jgi:hypothetical protein
MRASRSTRSGPWCGLSTLRRQYAISSLKWLRVVETYLVRGVVLLKYTETAGEAETAEEDAEGAGGVEPGFMTTVRGGAEGCDLFVGGGGLGLDFFKCFLHINVGFLMEAGVRGGLRGRSCCCWGSHPGLMSMLISCVSWKVYC